jgi:hypothetical protein
MRPKGEPEEAGESTPAVSLGSGTTDQLGASRGRLCKGDLDLTAEKLGLSQVPDRRTRIIEGGDIRVTDAIFRPRIPDPRGDSEGPGWQLAIAVAKAPSKNIRVDRGGLLVDLDPLSVPAGPPQPVADHLADGHVARPRYRDAVPPAVVRGTPHAFHALHVKRPSERRARDAVPSAPTARDQISTRIGTYTPSPLSRSTRNAVRSVEGLQHAVCDASIKFH